MARPFKEIDVSLLKKLAAIFCTMQEMSDIVGVSVDTLERNYADVIKEAKSTGKMSLRRWQWQACEKGNPALLIWMGKQHLGQSEPLRLDVTGMEKNQTINIAFDPKQLTKKLPRAK